MDPDRIRRATDLDALPRMCPDRPRVAARIKAVPEDFEVEEVPIYPPQGSGDHLFLWVEKRDCSGGELLRRLTSALRLRPGEIGAAGTKDRRAVTRQWLSVPADREEAVAGLSLDRIRVLAAVRHTNKLRLGHLLGNRFRILLRDAPPESCEAMIETGRWLEATGFYNLYGPQRFGQRAETLRGGLALLGNGGDTRNDPRIGPFERRMLISSVQSALFNLYVAERVGRGLERTVLRGDVMGKTVTGGLFRAEDVAAEQARFDAGETRLTGPMFGHKMMDARDESGGMEGAVLASAGLEAERFKVFSKLAEGTRRPLVVRPTDFAAEGRPEGVLLSFFLPKGCYASVMLREFVTEAAAADES
ncbi:MAG: tRNA pseudouridine(13) synthase TruD [Deltaproteobacteria bacterium]|nr:tRNA pseudouridine(13) synthase TruD [Deltaproteobacteria bacterium]